MRAAVVIPALNEAGTIGEIVSRLKVHGDPLVVDDGSTDETAAVAERAGAEVLRHPRNRGYDGALRTGLDRAAAEGYDVVVTMDADGQHHPDLVRDLAAPILAGTAGISLGVRPSAARPSERAFNWYTRRRFGAPDILCGMKAYRGDLVQQLGTSRLDGSIGTGLALAALRAGVTAAFVDVPISPRDGRARFGTGLRPNLRILGALFRALRAEVLDR